MASLLDRIEYALYENFVAKDELNLAIFTMANAWKFFMECAEKNKKVKECMLDVVQKGDGYKITQLMLDANGMPVKTDADYCVGRIVKAEALDGDVQKFLNGSSRKNIKLPY